jgi:hypothetical protein
MTSPEALWFDLFLQEKGQEKIIIILSTKILFKNRIHSLIVSVFFRGEFLPVSTTYSACPLLFIRKSFFSPQANGNFIIRVHPCPRQNKMKSNPLHTP